MTADAIALYDLCPVAGQGNPLRYQAGVERDHILHAVDRFPNVVDQVIVVGQVTIDTTKPSVCAGMAPGGVLLFHDVAAGAEAR